MAQGAVERLLPGVPAAIARLLEPAAGTLAVPIRSEIFGPQRFAQHGRSLGLTHRAERPLMRRATFFPRLRNNIAVLRQAQAAIADQAAAGYGTSPAAQWLLDNAHLIEAQLLAIHEGLPRSYFRNLPVLLDASLAGLPRIYGVAWAFVAHTDGAFDDDLLVGFLGAYQETRELRLGEIWALPTTLRVVLVENLRRLAERLAANMAARSVADLVCDHIEQWSVERLARVGELLVQRGAATPFYARMAQRLQDRAVEAHLAAPDAVLAWLRTLLPNLATVQAQEGLDQTADNLSVSNAVTSLRVIGDADWPAIVARASRLMQLMLAAPSFAAEHMLTRDQTLHAIERLARRSRRSEERSAFGPATVTTFPASSAPVSRVFTPRSMPMAVRGRAWRPGTARSTSTVNDTYHRWALRDTVADRMRAGPFSSRRASLRVDSWVAMVPSRGSVTVLPAQRSTPVLNRNESRHFPRFLKWGNPSRRPLRSPFLDFTKSRRARSRSRNASW